MASRADLDRIERDIEDARRDAGAAINALEERLNPNRLFNDAMVSLRHSTTVRQMQTSLADNIAPILLIAAGVSWWAYNLTREREIWDERHYGPRSSPYAPTPASLDPLVLPDETPHSHHVHIARSDPDAPEGRAPDPGRLLGREEAHKSAAHSARVLRDAGDGRPPRA